QVEPARRKGASTIADRGGSGFLPHPTRANAPSTSTVRRLLVVWLREDGIHALLSVVAPWPSIGSAAGSVVNSSGPEGERLEFLGQIQGLGRRPLGRRLALGSRGIAEEKPPPQLVVVTLVRLDRLTVEASGCRVPGRLAELDELAVLHDGDRFPGELAGGNALHGGSEPVEV